MTQLAYIRVSSVGQSLEVQRDKVTAEGLTRRTSSRRSGPGSTPEGQNSRLAFEHFGKATRWSSPRSTVWPDQQWTS